MNAIVEPETNQISQLHEIVHAACKRVPPLWSLRNFVAVNPFVGMTDRHFIEAATLMQKVGPGEMLMPTSFYLTEIAAGRITESDIETAIEGAKETLPPTWAREIKFCTFATILKFLSRSTPDDSIEQVMTFADFLDAKGQTEWATFVVEEISKWCSAYFDKGQSSWQMPWRQLNLFSAWKSAARLDLNPELLGLRKFRSFVSNLPDDHWEVIDRALCELDVPDRAQTNFLHRQLMSLAGWSSYAQNIAQEQHTTHQSDLLAQLLAIRLVYDSALLHQFGNDIKLFGEWQDQLDVIESSSEKLSFDLLGRSIAQQALECGYQRRLIAKLKRHALSASPPGQKLLQAIFCIDVRSEVFRRALEAQSEQIETIGFAGFFGMAIEYLRFGQNTGTAQCPVLIKRRFTVREATDYPASEGQLLRRMNYAPAFNGAWNAFKTSAISCFSFVETAGLWFGLKLVKDSLALTSAKGSSNGIGQTCLRTKIEVKTCHGESHPHGLQPGITLQEEIVLAANLLKNMGLVSGFAKIVLFCGHGSTTTNNPYGSALDCGACGGHAGDINARVAASILNQNAVREGLRARGINVPRETVFIAALHNTTTDEILIYREESLSSSQESELKTVAHWLQQASKQARRERAAALGLGNIAETKLYQNIAARSRDWSQIRPEWGLAGNAAFIAAPRARTRNLNLGGRTFLHDYNANLDPDNATLELILSAPMVVASWINLQYYGSTVDNRLFGSGNKVLHNVVGTFGVWQGNGGDLKTGLPLQSLHDGKDWIHTPLRLSVFIEATRENIESVLARQPRVLELFENGWLQLFAMEDCGKKIFQFSGKNFSAKHL